MRQTRTYFLCIDPARHTVARYLHHWGTWDVRHLTTAVIEPPEVMKELGLPAAREMLEQFRLTGVVK